MGVFRLKPDGLDPESLELDLIDHGLEEMGESLSEKGEAQLVVRCAFPRLRKLQKAMKTAASRRSWPNRIHPHDPGDAPRGKATEALKLIDILEQDEDVQRVFHTLA